MPHDSADFELVKDDSPPERRAESRALVMHLEGEGWYWSGGCLCHPDEEIAQAVGIADSGVVDDDERQVSTGPCLG